MDPSSGPQCRMHPRVPLSQLVDGGGPLMEKQKWSEMGTKSGYAVPSDAQLLHFFVVVLAVQDVPFL